ncbi:MAG: hypothetical protein K2Y01_01885 [Rhabdochlamydiaceae bacterium]|nr:hypothetical protein [Rhabdochlamydiaceae bacterium]
MSTVALNRGITRPALAAFCAGCASVYLKSPRSATDLNSSIYHGTTSDRMPDIQVGEVFKVHQHFFFTDDFDGAKNYAQGLGYSAFRTGQSSNGRPRVLRVSPLNPSIATWMRGFFGGNKYFPHGTELKVEEIQHPPEIDPKTKAEIEKYRGIG